MPLAFIFPGWIHLRLCRGQGAAGVAVDVVLVAFGCVMAPVAVVAVACPGGIPKPSSPL